MTADQLHPAGPDTQIENLEIVVDRIVMKKNFQDKERLIDSIETAMKLGKGEVVIASTEGNLPEKKYNRYLICPDCQVMIPEITPRHFSFNNPEGACPACSGLGTKLEVDIDQIIPNKNLSLKEGAVKPWSGLGLRGGIQNGYHRALEALSEKYNFSLDRPMKDLAKARFRDSSSMATGSLDTKALFPLLSGNTVKPVLILSGPKSKNT